VAKPHLKLVTPTIVNRTVTPKRAANRDLRTREYLTPDEVERLMAAAKGNRWGHRDATMVLVAYRHGLRAAELVDLQWTQVDFKTATLHVRRVKAGRTLFSAMSYEPCGGSSGSIHPHMLRHACGYALANKGHDTRALQALL
jgi:type 1 fimbriae regulatory protein FimB/type 1 fimbriae regulatory protein FimE